MPASAQLFDEDGVGAAQEICILLADLTQNANTEAGAGKGVPVDHVEGQAQLHAELAHLILEQLAQRLHQLHVHALAAHVVVGLDHMGLPGLGARGLDHVRVDRSLGQPADT